MRKLSQEKEVVQLAAVLQVDWRQNAVENIINLCQSKIASWLPKSSKLSSIQELERIVCQKLKLVFEMVWNDDDLTQIIRKYLNLGEPIFGTLKADLDDKTFATLIERRKVNASSPDRYVAVVDCRGVKAARRFFTRWHEIAHLLTLHGQLELPLHRSTKSPTERLMDAIAGEIGFFDPLFNPILVEEMRKEGRLSLTVVESVRERFCPEASFQATLNACVKRCGSPVVVLEVGLGLKKKEEKTLKSCQGELIPSEPPKAKLRVLSVVGNKWATKSNLMIHRNMQVPTSSLIHKLYFQGDPNMVSEGAGYENLAIWRHSDGTALGNIGMFIQAKKLQDSVVAIVTLSGFRKAVLQSPGSAHYLSELRRSGR